MGRRQADLAESHVCREAYRRSASGRMEDGLTGLYRSGMDRVLQRVDPRIVDAVLAIAIAVFALIEVWPGYVPVPDRWARTDWIRYLAPVVLALASTLPLAYRRRYPVGVLLVIGASMAVWLLRGGESPGAVFLAFFVAIFSASAYATNRSRSLFGLGVLAVLFLALWWSEGQLDLWLLFIFAFTSGIWLAGDTLRARTVEARRLTGYLPGELKPPAHSTAIGYLTHLGRLRGGVQRRAVEELAGRLELDLERKIGDLSKGNKQKVGIVAAFMHDPELLILDEPTSGLDPIRQEDVLDLVRERAAAGRTVFLSSHELDQVEHVAERVGIVREGRLVAVDSIAALKERAIRKVEVRLAGPAAGLERLREVPGVESLARDGDVVRLEVHGSMDALVKALAVFPVQTLTSRPPELDEIFLSYYGRSHAG